MVHKQQTCLKSLNQRNEGDETRVKDELRHRCCEVVKVVGLWFVKITVKLSFVAGTIVWPWERGIASSKPADEGIQLQVLMNEVMHEVSDAVVLAKCFRACTKSAPSGGDACPGATCFNHVQLLLAEGQQEL